MRSIVAVERQESYEPEEIGQKLWQMLAAIKAFDRLKGKRVLIKPNCTGAYSPEEGRTTHPVVLEQLVEILGKAEVTIGESSSVGVDTSAAYEKTGVKAAAENLGVRLVDFKKSCYQEVRLHSSEAGRIWLPKEVLAADYVVSLAKLKTSYLTGISCSMKNMKGVLRDEDKKRFHLTGLSRAVSDLAGHFRNAIAVVDGVIGSELYTPKKANVLVASLSMASCDAACAAIMGIEPGSIEHIRLAGGAAEPYRIIGAAFQEVGTRFEAAPNELGYLGQKYGIRIIDGKPCSSCIGALCHTLEKIARQKPALLAKLTIAVGAKPEEHVGNDCVLIGNCARNYSNGQIIVLGCAPTSEMIIAGLARE